MVSSCPVEFMLNLIKNLDSILHNYDMSLANLGNTGNGALLVQVLFHFSLR